jgi:hypothetical protein
LSFLKGTKIKVNVIKVKAEVKLLSTKLGKGRGGKLGVKARLFNSVESRDI